MQTAKKKTKNKHSQKKTFCSVTTCYLQSSCYIIANVAKEALMASHAVTDVQVIHFGPKFIPQTVPTAAFVVVAQIVLFAICRQLYLVQWHKKTSPRLTS